MYEVEIKVPAAIEAVRARLVAEETSAERRGAELQRDVYYDAPHREFAETDEALRIRHVTPLSDGMGSEPAGETETVMTYKGPLIDDASKTREEHETDVSDAEATAGIFDGLGFIPAATVNKEREFWTLDGVTVTLDVVKDVGEFVEVELSVPDEADVDEARERAVTVLDRIGLDADDQVRTSYLGLLCSR